MRPDRDRRRNAAAPIVAYGEGAILRTPRHVAAAGARRVLLVCGRRSFDLSGAARMLPELEAVAEVRRWSEFAANTDSVDLRAGLEVAAGFSPHLVLGVGGGSAMDMAKLLCAYGELADAASVEDAIRAGGRIASRPTKLFLAPTTSGSGSEATHFAVVYIGDDKHSIGGPGMRPDAVVLDPALSTTASAYQRATSGIDAVSQAIESLWAAGASQRSRRFARHAMRLLLPAIEPFVADPSSSTARAMCLGSHLAGRAIDVSRTTAAHALSYGITKRHGISHGHAVALTLGPFIAAHADAGPDRLQPGVDATAHSSVIREVLGRLGAGDGADAHRRFVDLLRRLDLTPTLTEAGITTEAERRALAASVNVERLDNNPVAFEQQELLAILARASGPVPASEVTGADE